MQRLLADPDISAGVGRPCLMLLTNGPMWRGGGDARNVGRIFSAAAMSLPAGALRSAARRGFPTASASSSTRATPWRTLTGTSRSRFAPGAAPGPRGGHFVYAFGALLLRTPDGRLSAASRRACTPGEPRTVPRATSCRGARWSPGPRTRFPCVVEYPVGQKGPPSVARFPTAPSVAVSVQVDSMKVARCR